MAGMDVMARLRVEASAWVAQELRSTSAVMGHLRPLIQEAHGIGHSHQAIHGALQAAGLRASWNTYRSCLMRMKQADTKSKMATVASAARPPGRSETADEIGLAAAAAPITPPPHAHADRPVPPSASGTHVRDALLQAREVASRDYAQVARDLRRRSSRPSTPKHLP